MTKVYLGGTEAKLVVYAIGWETGTKKISCKNVLDIKFKNRSETSQDRSLSMNGYTIHASQRFIA